MSVRPAIRPVSPVRDSEHRGRSGDKSDSEQESQHEEASEGVHGLTLARRRVAATHPARYSSLTQPASNLSARIPALLIPAEKDSTSACGEESEERQEPHRARDDEDLPKG